MGLASRAASCAALPAGAAASSHGPCGPDYLIASFPAAFELMDSFQIFSIFVITKLLIDFLFFLF